MGGVPLRERQLDSVAVISVPTRIKEEILQGARKDRPGELAFTFGSSYFWASMGSTTTYKQFLVVSLMAPDAPAEAYEAYPPTFRISLEQSSLVHSSTNGTATITATAGVYTTGSLAEPSHRFEYRDPARRLHIMWHAVDKEVSLADGLQMLEAMAASFRIVADPVATFDEMRDRPRRDAEEQARRLTVARTMLAAAGLGDLEPGVPVLVDGMYVEWTADPEPRYQLLVPLGTVAAVSPSGGIPPRPAQLPSEGGAVPLQGTIGWLSFTDDAWTYSNGDNAYLPFPGTAALLSAQHTDPGEAFYYYSATVRVEEEDVEERLTSLRWFTAGIADVKRLWREGKIVPGARAQR